MSILRNFFIQAIEYTDIQSNNYNAMLIIATIQKFNKNIVQLIIGKKEETFKGLLFQIFSDFQPYIIKIKSIFRKVIDINFPEKKAKPKVYILN